MGESGGGHRSGSPRFTRYARARRVGDLLSLAGMSSRLPDNSIRGASGAASGALELDIRVQTKGCIENLRAALAAWNGFFDDSGPTRTRSPSINFPTLSSRSSWAGELAELSARSFLDVNFMIISLIAVAVVLARRVSSAGFLGVAVFTQFGLHGLIVHLAFSLWRGEPWPGHRIRDHPPDRLARLPVVRPVPLAKGHRRWSDRGMRPVRQPGPVAGVLQSALRAGGLTRR